jgi:hypothetical protein
MFSTVDTGNPLVRKADFRPSGFAAAVTTVRDLANDIDALLRIVLEALSS